MSEADTRVLSHRLDLSITTECWTAYRLAALLADERFYPWFYERFINVTMIGNHEVLYYPLGVHSIENQYVYDEVLEFRVLSQNERLVPLLGDAVAGGWFGLVNYDRYYVEGSEVYRTGHAVHDTLVLGMDEENGSFLCLDFRLRGKMFGVHRIAYSQLEAAFKSALSIMVDNNEYGYYSENLPLTVFRPRIDFARSLLPGRVLDTLKVYRRGGETVCGSCPSVPGGSRFWLGRSVFQGFYDGLRETLELRPCYLREQPYVLIRAKTLYESKVGLADRLEYMDKQGLWSFGSELHDRLALLSRMLHNAFLLLVRYSLAPSSGRLASLCSILRKAEALDSEIVDQVVDRLEEAIGSRLRNARPISN